ncbi:MBL fold metallo-hydrolase [candidate division WOR-3 bacterium]|nr:MBL fold metallo-hydrolase [candidate division WOR-3 bacterium]
MKDNERSSGSLHFRVEQLADGVYAAIHKDGGGAISNAGIVDLGNRILVFDTFLTPQAARDLKAAAEALTMKPVVLVVNSHCHNDHIWGNQVFKVQADILSTVATAEAIVSDGPGKYEWYRENTPQQLVELQASYDAAGDPRERSELSLWIAYYQHLTAAINELEVVPPNKTFDSRTAINGTARTAELIEYRKGHSSSDAILYLPQDSIVFMGDLLFIDSHPYLGDGDPDTLIENLREIQRIGAKIFVPGHGPVGAAADLPVLVEYVIACQEIVRGMIRGGIGKDAVDAVDVPERFASWQQVGFFRSNLRFLYGRLSEIPRD